MITERLALANRPSSSLCDHCTFMQDGRSMHTADKPITKMMLWFL